jgi:hypothetical protein
MEIDFDAFICELVQWHMMARELLRGDATLRQEFSGQLELVDFMMWQSKRLLWSAHSEEAKEI